ncbi:hypothetical protein IIA15_10385, partial [candidate division TA06 bacterium]|nr:hypothetical protein [candidate division TA06 bacterium]
MSKKILTFGAVLAFLCIGFVSSDSATVPQSDEMTAAEKEVWMENHQAGTYTSPAVDEAWIRAIESGRGEEALKSGDAFNSYF